MLQQILFGGSLAFAAGVQPGPLQAFLLSRTATDGWKRTLPAAFSPLLSDGPIAVLVLLVVGSLPVAAEQVLRTAGGLLLLYLAWSAFRQWRRSSDPGRPAGGSAPRTLFQAATVNLLNPNPYLGWALVLGPALLNAWRQGPENAIALVAAFYVTLIATQAAFILLAGTTQRLGPRGRRALILASALVLAGLGVYQIAAGLAGSGGR